MNDDFLKMNDDICCSTNDFFKNDGKINDAFCFAMLGREDRKINEYFIYNAFPEESLINNLLNIISDYDGISRFGEWSTQDKAQ